MKLIKEALSNLASIASIVSVGWQLQHGQIKTPTPPPSAPPLAPLVIPDTEFPFHLKLVAALFCVSLSSWLENNQMIGSGKDLHLTPEEGIDLESELRREEEAFYEVFA
jgi:hypothetical protein